MSKRIAYQPIRNTLGFLTPMLLIIAMPHWLGITTPKAGYETFTTVLIWTVCILYAQAVIWLLYALIHNARLETYNANDTNCSGNCNQGRCCDCKK